MTEFETASLAIREWTLWVTASLQALAVGAILLGIWQMRRAGDQREKREDQRHREAMRASDARHAETMRASDARHAETMRAVDARHAEAMRSLEALIKGMETVSRGIETVIERTAPGPNA